MPDTFPNQKIIHINRDMPPKGSNDFLVVKNQNLYDAYRILRKDSRGATPLYLWLILAANKDGFDLALSPRAIEAQTGLPQSTCRDGIDALIRTGFLVPKREGSNVYDFYERPEFAQKTAPAPVLPEEKEVQQEEAEDAPRFVF